MLVRTRRQRSQAGTKLEGSSVLLAFIVTEGVGLQLEEAEHEWSYPSLNTAFHNSDLLNKMCPLLK